MNETQLAELKAKIATGIEDARQAIVGQTDVAKAITPDSAIGRISRMDAMYGKQINEATLQRSKSRLAKLEYVLAQIDTPDFGRCEFCGQLIHDARIMAMPESTVCVRCASFA